MRSSAAWRSLDRLKGQIRKERVKVKGWLDSATSSVQGQMLGMVVTASPTPHLFSTTKIFQLVQVEEHVEVKIFFLA